MRPFATAFLLALGLATGCVPAIGADDATEKGGALPEADVVLPHFPEDANLHGFSVSAVATNRYLVDMKSISVGDDGIVRYTLVVLTAGGATNISYEGMRCRAGAVKLYATGRADRTWSMARAPVWRLIENKPVNRHHAALARDYFCPIGNPIRSAHEGAEALRRGRHPDLP